MIEIKNVNKKMKDHVILKNISISIKKGICVGFVGHNGSGKTMLLKAICGFTKIDIGEIWVDNKQIIFSEKYIKNAGVIIEQPSFINYLTGMDNLLALANIQKMISKNDVLLALKKVGLIDAKDKKVKEYSLGMKQRLRIAQAIMEHPHILILDEPFNGLDKDSITEIQDLILDYKNKGTTILLTSHDDRQIDYLCDQVYELNGGEIVE
ncbi:ABC transporter ATP-binding protein [Pseudogracilibacillus auburnensis]|uniref:ABC transporter ATP-binding protein n=1 Tax=Pseudogracilibacillus auburnensis TaxID=1494959 RepID=UPI001A97B673|nr:ATP-binding cassette domain-containing protein [Pseudogracilibacillus auburnensis]MBO1004550.1 ATP-binding cassette domain-containing protein [Pseudogracilibacillus auburnensis]